MKIVSLNMICSVKKSFLVKVTLILVLLGSQIQIFAGQIYYISPQGSKSLAHAVRVARPGDTIIMRGGTYRMGEVWIEGRKGMGGALGRYLTIKAYPGEEPILKPGKRRLIIHANYVRVEGLHFVMPWRCEAFGRGLQIVNNKFTGPQPKQGAIETGGTDILIEGNIIQIQRGVGSTSGHGIYVHKGERITVRNNQVFDTAMYGIHVYDEHKSANPRDWAAHPFAIKDYILEGNFVSESQTRSGIIIAKGRGGRYITLENITIRNNIFVGNAEFGLFIRQGKDIKVYNNTFYYNRSAALFVKEPSKGSEPVSHVSMKNNIFVGRAHIRNKSPGENIVLENNLYNAGPRLQGIIDAKKTVGDPQFVDSNAHDFHLQTSSPAIDAGTEVGLPFSGSAPDLGAFEFGLQPPGGDSPARTAKKSFADASPPLNEKEEQLYSKRNRRILSKQQPLSDQISSKKTASTTKVPAKKTYDTKASTANRGLVSFNAYIVDKSVILNWRTESEANYTGFEIERSRNKRDFTKIGFVKTQTNKNFQYIDQGLQPGNYYYRLKQVQMNGSFEYLSLVKININ